jgi:hypothetical protein
LSDVLRNKTSADVEDVEEEQEGDDDEEAPSASQTPSASQSQPTKEELMDAITVDDETFKKLIQKIFNNQCLITPVDNQ